jgi:bifunctional DNA-binding transcriptional regulator/antitoxin component of YhaV-PrlF toxin-antitoxin module
MRKSLGPRPNGAVTEGPPRIRRLSRGLAAEITVGSRIDWRDVFFATGSGYALHMAENVKKAGRSRISSKHQVTIPAAAFRRAGFQAGDTVRIEAEGAGRVVLTKVDDLVDRYSGSLATGGELRRSVQVLRDEW